MPKFMVGDILEMSKDHNSYGDDGYKEYRIEILYADNIYYSARVVSSKKGTLFPIAGYVFSLRRVKEIDSSFNLYKREEEEII
jgi:hypothetical protein